MDIATIIGARPQFVKSAPLSKELAAAGHTERLIHTGQHYDYGMSQVFFDDMGIRPPDLNLGVGSATHGRQTGEIMIRLEDALLAKRPDRLIVYGDTNSTLAAAITGAKLRIPLAHVEAGLRSFNRDMPEEQNRVLTDHCSDYLFCPTQTAVNNLQNEGITSGVYLVGDVMCDAVLMYGAVAAQRSDALYRLELAPRSYLLVTIHRPYNTDVAANLKSILEALAESGERVIFPVHPRTQKQIERLAKESGDSWSNSEVRFIDPIGYLDMIALQQNARMILTDSGGVQKEAYMLGVPCVTLRPETEWVETVEAGWNVLAGADKERICSLIRTPVPSDRPRPALYGDGAAARRIVELIQ